MKRICLYNILPLLCGFLFLACEKEEAGNGGTGIDDPPPITNGNDDITSLIQPQQTSVTFPYQKTDVIGNDLERYTVEGTGDVTLRSSIYPFYAFEKSNSNGDYYLIKAEVSVHNENMYKNSTYSYKREAPFDQWNYYTQRICGYYMREMRVSYELYDKYGNIIEDREYNTRDFDRNLVLEKRTELVAKYVTDYLKRNNKQMAKTIFFCIDQDHAGRMRQALVNENADMVKINDKYVMQITSDNEEGKSQIENFCNKNSAYPVLVTTSKLLSTGVDTKTVEVIVIDSNIESIIEFKQIIGRGTRLVEEKNKLYFTIIDFRNVTRHFADPDFDGEPLQSDEYDITKGSNDNNNDENDENIYVVSDNKDDTVTPDEPKTKQTKYYVDNVEVSILKDKVQYLDYNGKLITESFKDYTRKNIKNKYATLDNFLQAWNSAEKKSAIIAEMEKAGIFMEELKANTKKDLDPFDMLCHIAYDKPPLTKRERIENVKKRNYFAKYGVKVQEVINALLEKYAETDIQNIETIDILKLEPVNKLGNPMYIINNIFKGRKNFENIIKELENEIYAA